MSNVRIKKHIWPDRVAPEKIVREPFGYRFSEDKKMLIADSKALDYLEYAKKMIKAGRSSREVANWLTSNTDFKISHQGLLHRIERDMQERLVVQELDETHEAIDYRTLPAIKVKKTERSIKGKQNRKRANDKKTDRILEIKSKTKFMKGWLSRYQEEIKELVKNEDEDKVKELISLLPKETQEEVKKELEQEKQNQDKEIVAVETDENTNVVFKPNAGPQTDFLAASEDEVFYGGARGGGKTYSLIVDPLRYFTHSKFSGLLIRRTMPELRDIINDTLNIYPKLFPKAKYKVQENCWYFPSGARMEFGYAENVQDAERYRGRQYSWIGIDELPQYPNIDVYNLLKSSLRSAAPDLPTYMRATGNPGGVGAYWVKEKFIDPAPINTRFYEEVEFTDLRTNERKKVKRSLRFIPATVFDNPYLLHNDSYVAALASLPEVQRKQMLEGNWDIIADSAFPEFNRKIHVIEPLEDINYMLKFRAADWGYNSPFCCLWFAIDEDDNIYVYREYYGKNVLAEDFAKEIVRLEQNEVIMYGVIDGSTKAQRGDRGPSIFETINKTLKQHKKVAFRPADRSAGSRIAGKQEVHKRLALRDTGLLDEAGVMIKRPALYITNNCLNLIRTLPLLQTDKNDPEKVDTTGEDHAYDALHYGLRSRPITPARYADGMIHRLQNQHHVADNVFGY